MSSSEGYRTDIAYVTGFYEHQAPCEINHIAAINGFSPIDLEQAFTYCELGCGKGLTANLLAAANPNGRFWGVDFNPEHIVQAKAQAENLQIGNVEFLDCDFLALEARGLPQFDFITLHGVWSWVGKDVRDALTQFFLKHLKPGGLVMVSYNAMPGWASILPLREMMLAYVRGRAADLPVLDQVSHSLAYLKHMKEGGALFFQNHPAAAKKVDELLATDPRYIAHEYFNAHWQPFFCREVADELVPAGLGFAGTWPQFSNYAELVIPPALRDFFRGAPDRGTYETHKDFALDTKFRRDIYVKSGSPAAGAVPALASIRFALLAEPGVIPLKGSFDSIQYDLAGTLVPRVLALLGAQPRTAQEILAALDDREVTLADVLSVLQQLGLTRALVPVARRQAPALPAGNAGLPAVNENLLKAGLAAATQQISLVSSLRGSIVTGDKWILLAAAAIAVAGRAEAPAWCARFVRESGLQLTAENGGDPTQALAEAVGGVGDADVARLASLGLFMAAA